MVIDISLILQNEYFQSGLVLLSSFILASITYRFLGKLYVRFARRTATAFDDGALSSVALPIYYLIIFIGIYVALRSLSIIAIYEGLLNKIFFILAVILIAISLSSTVNTAFGHWASAQRGVQKTPKLVTKIINGIIYLIGFLIILNFFNVAITPLLATLGVGALALGLALQPTLTNFFAGLRILSDKPVSVGDFIEFEKMSGHVEDIGWNTTRIRTLQNTMIVVPNSKLADSTFVNTSLPINEITVFVDCGVSYTSDLDRVEKVTLEVARKIQKTVPGAVTNFQPFMRYTKFGASNIDFTIRLMAESSVDSYVVVHEFIKALKKRYDQEHIEIAYNTVKSIPVTADGDSKKVRGGKKKSLNKAKLAHAGAVSYN